jgi:hypothetical protein
MQSRKARKGNYLWRGIAGFSFDSPLANRLNSCFIFSPATSNALPADASFGVNGARFFKLGEKMAVTLDR